MDRSRRFRWVALVATVALIAVTVVVLFAAGFLATTHPSTAPAPLPRTFLNLTIVYDASTGIANYTAPFLSVVANTLVVVTITNYDPTVSPLLVPWDNHVVGTVGGNETLNCGHGIEEVSSLPSTGISHTFTVFDAYYNVSIPIPPAPSVTVPCVVTFELTMDHEEITNWGCVVDCDNGQMAAGRMWGLLLIAA